MPCVIKHPAGTAFRLLASRILVPLFLSVILSGCKLSFTIEGNGAGAVLVDGAEICSNVTRGCETTAAIGSRLKVTAEPLEGSAFVRWTEGCSGTDPHCEINVTGPLQIGAVFARPDYVEQAENCGTADATSRCLEPVQSPEYYVDQSIKYFLTMESSVSPLVIPRYSDRVVRWEWPPWLLLTGYGRFNLIWTDIVLKLNPTTYAVMNCQAFDVQPFGRCHVVFDYSGELCPIYEEFTFNDAGEITFIEAWTDMPGWIPMAPEDHWAEGNIPGRLSTRVPGLGNGNGLVDWGSEGVASAAAKDADVAELVDRVNDPYRTWLQQLIDNPRELAEGCDPDHIGFELD
ncbi:MAG: hypothetical protein R3208_13540 [Ketobacteraceae bacterium]|nr:hypothetical protein [Ketobacteraceae bacterium]